MRCFFAIPVSGEAAQVLTRTLTDLRRQYPEVRWEAPEALHLTLQFIGTWPDARLQELTAAAGGWRWLPFTLHLTALGAFPNLRRPRIVWAGAEAHPSLSALVDGLARQLAPLGLEREARPFTPHISLARIKPGQRLGLLPAAISGALPGEEFCLYETVPGAPVAQRYQVRGRFPAAA
ncbi:MAG: RNA 2',3'-cyclic phosphodiesterase [Terriglobales bacterium]